ncbi:phosphatidate cytidylyltransferase [Gammaproteobacteria bacterium AB-CW1]|uniref:Phosphatidate cytidylyltransferase n=1 Tax=Natronospira elongata TaxID=3110268 RepID=A0AAP6JDB2_9GAMM|nr:phosphatidate cytidylyltransferase [Gammaproteobacteria bacterium AB-CW1]
MLRQRIITALVVGPLAIAAIFFLPNLWFGVVLAAVVGLAGEEWAALASPEQRGLAVAYAALVAGLSLLLQWQGLAQWAVWLVLPVWLLGLAWLCLPTRRPPALSKLLFGLLVLLGAWSALFLLHGEPLGAWLLLTLFGLVWGADVGAYFAGKAFGRHKLAPRVSPGKTWEGVAGGLLLAALVAVVAAWWLNIERLGPFVFLALLTAGLSVTGDLIESMLKRQAGAKDSGWILPGHGGILDRVDSLLIAAPIFLVGLMLLGEPA